MTNMSEYSSTKMRHPISYSQLPQDISFLLFYSSLPPHTNPNILILKIIEILKNGRENISRCEKRKKFEDRAKNQFK